MNSEKSINTLKGKDVILHIDGGWMISGNVVLDNDEIIILAGDDEDDLSIVYKTKICIAKITKKDSKAPIEESPKEEEISPPKSSMFFTIKKKSARDMSLKGQLLKKLNIDPELAPEDTSLYLGNSNYGSFLPPDLLVSEEPIEPEEDFGVFFGTAKQSKP